MLTKDVVDQGLGVGRNFVNVDRDSNEINRNLTRGTEEFPTILIARIFVKEG